MSFFKDHPRRKWVVLIVLIVLVFALVLGAVAAKKPEEKAPEPEIGGDYAFSVLILGDSQMAGFGWEGGYQNCLSEYYPNAVVVNLAQSGSLLANGDIHAQWEYFLAESTVMPHFILLDGGINDLPYLRQEGFTEESFTIVSDALCSLVEHIHQVSPDTRILYTTMFPLAEWKDSAEGPPSYTIQERYWKHMSRVANTYDYITVLDLFSINPLCFPNADSYREHLADSIHLNEAGYRKTFEYIKHAFVPHLTKALYE